MSSETTEPAEPETPLWKFTWFLRKEVSKNGLRMTFSGDELAFAHADIANAEPHEGGKNTLPLICLATFDGDHRGNPRVERTYAVGLDIDDPQSDPDAYISRISAALGGVEIFAYSTFSSQPGAYRLRVIIPHQRPATSDEHKASWNAVARILARAGINIDRACSDPARGFYIWAMPPNRAYFHKHIPGKSWNVDLAADVATRIAGEVQPKVPAFTRSTFDAYAATRARKYVAKMPPAVAGNSGHAATFAVARKLVADFALADNDAWNVLLDYNTRCQPPWSERELAHKLEQAKNARVRVDMGGP